jgi:WD40 repeat protein
MVSRWRERHDQALLVVDQFEELFTLNTGEVQEEFSDLMRRLVDDAGVHVLLSMRDDFLFRIHDHPPLAPILDELTLLGAPKLESLHLAVVEPARQLGFTFEDEGLPDEMIAEVKGERGALPMLAFAISRLWEKRDRERQLLTRQASDDIGGVAGALAQHAEAAIARIGSERLPIVREIFRNLVTADGTRAVREWNELLSVFSDSPSESRPEEVLRHLIDARLLTSYEIRKDDDVPTRSVEIIHESLLANWPRLVRWQTQDADAARIRDELRHAARAWNDHDRTDDLLWAGAAYREFRLWHNRYPGGLTEGEKEFSTAMTAHAKRRKRRRRIAVAAAFVVLLAVLAVVGFLWQKSELQARRAEASELIALGQLELEAYPTAAVAYAITSLELADSQTARLLAVEALWKGPAAFVVNKKPTLNVQFTSDGQWLTQGYFAPGDGPVRLIRDDGTCTEVPDTEGHESTYPPGYGTDSPFFALQHWTQQPSGTVTTGRVSLWFPPENRMIGEASFGDLSVITAATDPGRRRLVILVADGPGRVKVDALSFDGNHEHLGTIELEAGVEGIHRRIRFSRGSGKLIAASAGREVFLVEIGDASLSTPRLVGRHSDDVTRLAMGPRGRYVAAANVNGDIRLWPVAGGAPTVSVPGPPNGALRFTADGNYLSSTWFPQGGDIRAGKEMQFWMWAVEPEGLRFLRKTDLGLQAPMSYVVPDHDGGRFVRTGGDETIRIWRRFAPADALPLELLRGNVGQVFQPLFHPDGRWLAAGDGSGLSMWPLARPYPIILRRHTHDANGVLFAPDGRWLAAAWGDGTATMWPLEGVAPGPGRLLFEPPGFAFLQKLATDSEGTRILVGGGPNIGVNSVSLENESNHLLPFSETCIQYHDLAVSPDGRLAAATCGDWNPEFRRIDIWNLRSGERIAELSQGKVKQMSWPVFVGNERLLALDVAGLRLWELGSESSILIQEGSFNFLTASKNGRSALLVETSAGAEIGRAVFLDLKSGDTTELDSHGDRVSTIAVDDEGTVVVTGDPDGTIRAGPVTGANPHVLSGHKEGIDALAVDPLGRWIASGSADNTVRLWPMPDLSKPPLHTLPRDELIAKLKTLTNVRVVRDEESANGWKLTHDPFPGWETVPTWK